MLVDLVMLRRFRSESAGMIPVDLQRWAPAALCSGLSVPERIAARDDLLREAGSIAGGTTWARMIRVRLEILRKGGPAPGPIGELVGEALALTPGRVPSSKRQLLRIFQGH